MISGYQLRDKFANGRTTLENSILLDDQLTATEKFIYLIIEMLSYKDNFCTATDPQLEELTGNTLQSVKFSIKRLKAKKYIIVDTKQSRKPAKRRIFTLDRFLKAHWSQTLPKDCTVKKPPLPPTSTLNITEIKSNFMKFRKFLRQYMCEHSFNVTTAGALQGQTILIKKNGYYTNKTINKDLTREHSALFERLMWDKREEIINNFFKDKEETEDEN